MVLAIFTTNVLLSFVTTKQGKKLHVKYAYLLVFEAFFEKISKKQKYIQKYIRDIYAIFLS